MEYLSSDNKGMMWGILQESNIFTDIPDEKFHNVKAIFDDTMMKINATMGTMSLMEKNKITVEELISKINKEKTNYSTSARTDSKVKIVYRAEDLHKERSSQLNNKMEQQRNELTTLINPNKPADINFADDITDGDKPIGNDMDRLISERLASRERELEIPKITEEGEKWLNANANANANTTSDVMELEKDKKVTTQVVNNVTKQVSFRPIPDESINRLDDKPSIGMELLLNKIKKNTHDKTVRENNIYSENESEHESENLSKSIKEEIESLINTQEELISENIRIKNRLNIILNKI